MDNNRSLSVGAPLRKYRRMAGLTPPALVQRAWISPRAAGAMERGPIRLYRRDTVALRADALGLCAAAPMVIEAAAFASDEAVRNAALLAARPPAPYRRILATGRPALGVPRGHAVAVPPSERPAAGGSDPNVPPQSPTVTLFKEIGRKSQG